MSLARLKIGFVLDDTLDSTACRLLTQRARFDPKLDSSGEPTTGTWSSSFRWQLQN